MYKPVDLCDVCASLVPIGGAGNVIMLWHYLQINAHDITTLTSTGI
jgi:hypothetical protein